MTERELADTAAILQWRLGLRHEKYRDLLRKAGLEHRDDLTRREWRRRLLQLARPGKSKGRPFEDFDREQFRSDLAAAWLRLSADGYAITRAGLAERMNMAERTLTRRLRALGLTMQQVRRNEF
jgi:AraC-like DNA-binding protein